MNQPGLIPCECNHCYATKCVTPLSLDTRNRHRRRYGNAVSISNDCGGPTLAEGGCRGTLRHTAESSPGSAHFTTAVTPPPMGTNTNAQRPVEYRYRWRSRSKAWRRYATRYTTGYPSYMLSCLAILARSGSWYGMICLMVLYLFLVAGLSREHVNAILAIQQRILTLFVQEEAIDPPEEHDPISTSLPMDIRTVMGRLDIEPEILRDVCCPRCFRRYPIQSSPDVCTHRETMKSRTCDTPLFRKKNIAYRHYNTQSLETWLRELVSRQDILEELERCRTVCTVREPLRDVQDSPQWHSFLGKCGSGRTTRKQEI